MDYSNASLSELFAAAKRIGSKYQEQPTTLVSSPHFESVENLDDWIEVESSCIEAIALCRQSSILKIRFLDSGAEYEYRDVSSDVFNDFRNADSQGRFFNDYIKDNYSHSSI